jgi:hypothetical protein
MDVRTVILIAFETLSPFERFLYLWLVKDFIWIQNYYEIGLIAIGVVAFWWTVCLFSLLRSRKRTETYVAGACVLCSLRLVLFNRTRTTAAVLHVYKCALATATSLYY